MPPRVHIRDVPPRIAWALEQAGVHPLLARLFAARGVRITTRSTTRWRACCRRPRCTAAMRRRAGSPTRSPAGERICVVADYDCDGATACAVALRGLRCSAPPPGTLHYVVPDRARHGYGLTPAIVDLALRATRRGCWSRSTTASPASTASRTRRRCGIEVLVTDHHLPAHDGDGRALLPDRRADRQPEPAGLRASRASRSPASA